MRLIDADKVKEYVLTEGFYCDTHADKEYTAELIDTLFPTVKAIPVEWIRKYTNHRTVEFGDMWVFINCMINDWEKENENN